jgi:hypothetical protein
MSLAIVVARVGTDPPAGQRLDTDERERDGALP